MVRDGALHGKTAEWTNGEQHGSLAGRPFLGGIQERRKNRAVQMVGLTIGRWVTGVMWASHMLYQQGSTRARRSDTTVGGGQA